MAGGQGWWSDRFVYILVLFTNDIDGEDKYMNKLFVSFNDRVREK